MDIKKIKKHFIRFECSSGTLAVEKHLYDYVKNHFAGYRVEEDAIPRIIKNIESEQDKYFQTHRGQRVKIKLNNNSCTEGKFIHIGQMCSVLILVKGCYICN